WIEPIEILQTSAALIVIPANNEVHILPRPHGNGVRVGPVAHDVPAAQNPVVLAFRIGEYGIECFEVGMDVAEYQVAHRRIRETSGGAPRRTGKPTVPRPVETYPATRSTLYKPRTYGV